MKRTPPACTLREIGRILVDCFEVGLQRSGNQGVGGRQCGIRGRATILFKCAGSPRGAESSRLTCDNVARNGDDRAHATQYVGSLAQRVRLSVN